MVCNSSIVLWSSWLAAHSRTRLLLSSWQGKVLQKARRDSMVVGCYTTNHNFRAESFFAAAFEEEVSAPKNRTSSRFVVFVQTRLLC